MSFLLDVKMVCRIGESIDPCWTATLICRILETFTITLTIINITIVNLQLTGTQNIKNILIKVAYDCVQFNQ